MSWVAQPSRTRWCRRSAAPNPDAPTLCEGWDVRRLLAHLVQREQGPVAGLKDAVARKPPGQEPGLSRLTEPGAVAVRLRPAGRPLRRGRPGAGRR